MYVVFILFSLRSAMKKQILILINLIGFQINGSKADCEQVTFDLCEGLFNKKNDTFPVFTKATYR